MHYREDDTVTAALASLHAAFPALKTLSIVQDVHWDQREWQARRDAKPTLAAGLSHFHSTDAYSQQGVRVSYPTLETLWVPLENADETTQSLSSAKVTNRGQDESRRNIWGCVGLIRTQAQLLDTTREHPFYVSSMATIRTLCIVLH